MLWWYVCCCVQHHRMSHACQMAKSHAMRLESSRTSQLAKRGERTKNAWTKRLLFENTVMRFCGRYQAHTRVGNYFFKVLFETIYCDKQQRQNDRLQRVLNKSRNSWGGTTVAPLPNIWTWFLRMETTRTGPKSNFSWPKIGPLEWLSRNYRRIQLLWRVPSNRRECLS